MKQAIKRILPAPLLVLATKARMLLSPNEHETRSRTLWHQLGSPLEVLGGPFAGMKYIGAARGSSLVTKLLGTYELELHSAFAQALAGDVDVVVDVGAAEGYYAVGIARTRPGVKVIAFEMDAFASHLLRRLAKLNGVQDRIDLRGAGTPTTLQAALAPARRPLVISDCEGYEDTLLDPVAVPALSRARVIVELHDHVVPGVTDRIRSRFTPTHDVQEITTRPRTTGDLPPRAASLKTPVTADMLNEYRPGPMRWLVMTPLGPA